MSPAVLLLHPDFLPWLLLAPATAAGLALLARRRALRLRGAVGPRHAALTRHASSRLRRGSAACFALGLLFTLAAALEPAFGTPSAPAAWRGLDLVIALDVSRSMQAGDLAPDRLTRAKAALRMLAERAVGDRLALVVFAGEARTRLPLSPDRRAFVDLVERADPTDVSRGGTDLGTALDAALALVGEAQRSGAAVLLLTDGEDHDGRAVAAARRAGGRGVPVFTLGIGTRLGGKVPLPATTTEGTAHPRRFLVDAAGREVVSTLDAEGLRNVARASGGEYVDVGASERALLNLYESRLLPRARAAVDARERASRPSRYQAPLAAGLLLFLVALGLNPRRTR